jgi:protein-S-isoprenylcysteine O-methyltransferase Ste14
MLKQIIMILGFALIFAAILCLTAGRFDWWRGWYYIGLTVLGGIVTMAIVGRNNPEVLAARSKFQRGTKKFDKIFLAIYLPSLLVVPVVAGLDAGAAGRTPLPLWTAYAGTLLAALAMAQTAWAMSVNPFAENTVRIQTERGHAPVSAGPYRYVRHPMYVGFFLGILSAPLILGSAWAFVPAGVIFVLFIVRTALEDRTLRRELPGYEEYAQRTCYRLLPGVW